MKLILRAGAVLTQDAARNVYCPGEVEVEGQTLSYVGPVRTRRAGTRYVLDAPDALLIPGLIHAHLHACQTLYRHEANDLALLEWLKQRIWPYEAALEPEDMRASADLAFSELLLGGSTAALDMGSVHHYDAVFESALDLGFRLVGGKALMDRGEGVPEGLLESTADALQQTERLIQRWHGAADGRLRYAIAPRFIPSCTPQLLRAVAARVGHGGVRLHTHASENTSEIELVRQLTGLSNIASLAQLGLLGESTTLAHCVWLAPEEIDTLARTATHVCHCPSSNLKLASGLAPVTALAAAGVNVALGADGAPCNNTLDAFQEMRLASQLQSVVAGAGALPAQAAFDLATRNGARALGLSEVVGSLEPGKHADLALVSTRRLHLRPGASHPVGALVYAAHSSDVSDVMVEGQWRVRNGQLLAPTARQVARAADDAFSRVARRLNPPSNARTRRSSSARRAVR